MADAQNTVSEFLRSAAEQSQDPRFEQYLKDRVHVMDVDELKELRRQINGTPKGTDPAPAVPEVFQGQRKAMILDITNNRLRALQLSVMQDKQRTYEHIYDAPVDALNIGLAKSADLALGTDFEKKYDSSTRSEKRKIGLLTIPATLLAGYVGYRGIVKPGVKVSEWMLERAKDFFGKERSISWKIVAPILAIVGVGGLTAAYNSWDRWKMWLPEEWREKAEEFMNKGKEKLKEQAVEVAQAALDRTELDLQGTDSASFARKKNTIVRILNASIKALLALNDPAAIEQFLDDNGFSAGAMREKEVPGQGGATFIISFDTAAKKFELREGAPATPPPSVDRIPTGTVEGLPIAHPDLFRDIHPNPVVLNGLLQDQTLIEEPGFVGKLLALPNNFAAAQVLEPLSRYAGNEQKQKALFFLCRACLKYKNDYLFGKVTDAQMNNFSLRDLFAHTGQVIRHMHRLDAEFPKKPRRTDDPAQLQEGLHEVFNPTFLTNEAQSSVVQHHIEKLDASLDNHEPEFAQFIQRNTGLLLQDAIRPGAAFVALPPAPLDTAFRNGVHQLDQYFKNAEVRNHIKLYANTTVATVANIESLLQSSIENINLTDALQLYISLEDARDKTGSLTSTRLSDAVAIGVATTADKLVEILGRSHPVEAQKLYTAISTLSRI